MPFTVPAFDEIRELLLAAMSGRFPNANLNRFGDLYKRLSVVALGVCDNHFHLRQVGLDVMPDTAGGEFLDRHATIWGLTRRGASGSAISAGLRIFGTAASTVPVNEALTHTASGLSFQTSSGGTIPAGGFLDVDIVAVSTGELTNLEVGQELDFDSTPTGLEQTTRIVIELEGGQDQETDSSLRDRVLNRIAEPAAGGNRNDMEQFVLEALADIDTAYVYPHRNGLGTVDLVGLRGGSGTARLLTAGERTTVFNTVDALRPVTMTIRMVEVTTATQDIEVLIVPESDPAYQFDWTDATAPTVSTYVAGTRTLTFGAVRPADMAVGDRLLLDDPLSDGTESVIESLSGTSAVVLTEDLGYAPTASSPVYSGSPITANIRATIQALFDSLGPANPDSASGQTYGTWEGNLRLSKLFEAIQTTTGVLDSTIVAPVANVEATDPAFPTNTTVELLIAGKWIIRKDNT